MYTRFKGSAIHNLIITKASNDDRLEGIVLGKNIMSLSDLHDGQEIIITRIGAGSWGNRIRTIAHMSEVDGEATVCGSLRQFLAVGELTCVIGEFYLEENAMDRYQSASFPIFDLGFDPATNKDNLIGNLDLQFANKTIRGVTCSDMNYYMAIKARKGLLRMYAKSVIMGLVINKTHPDCLQGSAELPRSVMVAGGLKQYRSVTVYNNTVGGAADTYAVPMPEGVVMTTGAMASFAKPGEMVNVVSYVISDDKVSCDIVLTNGEKVI